MGVPEVDEVMHAAQRLLKDLEVDLRLSAALRSKDRSKLQDALNSAHSNGVQTARVQEVRKMLDKIIARDSLSSAITGKCPEILRATISHAKAQGVDDAKIEKGMQALKRLEEIFETSKH